MFSHKKQRSRGAAALTLTGQAPFQIVEAYKAVRANLLFALSVSPKKSVIFTGAEPGSGKSTTCSNLALAMAQTGARVALVDTDMRKPVQHRVFRVSNTTGLSKLLGGLATLEKCIRRNAADGIDLIPAGPIPPNPAELLGSERMGQLLKALADGYDYVFLDAPPVNVVADALMYTDKAGGVLLVARQKQTHYDELQKAAESVRRVEGNVLGLVITDVDEGSKPYGQYKYKSYDYAYKN